MLNRLTNIFNEPASQGAKSDGSWDVDGNPGLRLLLLGLLLTLPLTAVFGRLVYLQGVIGDAFVSLPEETRIEYERIPGGTGRILTADGDVLAEDVTLFQLQMHYRRLEEPADERWLRQQALARLSREERRDDQKLKAAREAALREREELWRRIAVLCGLSPGELAEKRAAVQRRVERMIDNVESRRRQRREEALREREAGFQEGKSGLFETIGRTVWKTLTTPPARTHWDPVELPEETAYHPLVEEVPLEAVHEIEASPELYPGVRIRSRTRRIYPHNSFAAHVVGVRLPIGGEQLRQRSEEMAGGDPFGLRRRDPIGKSGLERAYDRLLRGHSGSKRIVRNRRGEILHTEVVRQPRGGEDITLTLHPPLQRQTEELLDRTIGARPAAGETAGAALVVLDAHNGEVLAAASAPRFDVNQLIQPETAEWNRILEDSRRPLFHRAARMAIAPGSVFKTLSAVALLESGQINPQEHYFCRGYLDTPHSHRCYIYTHYGAGHGETDLSDAICRSCNVYFFQAARTVGPEVLVEWAQKFGFGHATGSDLAGERGGNLPIPPSMRPVQLAAAEDVDDQRSEVRDQRSDSQHSTLNTQLSTLNYERGNPWYQGDTLGLAIGQSRLTVTPLQIARMMAAVANGGYLVTPHFVSRSGPQRIGTADEFAPPDRSPRRIDGLSESTLQRLQEALRRVVEDPRGTGYRTVRMEELPIAGKTGTAEVGGGRGDHAWFAGYLPADEPRYAFAVVLEHAGSGGRDAGPVARQLAQILLNVGLLTPRESAGQ